MWTIAINGEENITAQYVLDDLNHNQNPCGKSNIKISLCRWKSYQRTYLEYICSIFDQVRPIVLHLEFRLPKKSPTPKNIGESLKDGVQTKTLPVYTPYHLSELQSCISIISTDFSFIIIFKWCTTKFSH